MEEKALQRLTALNHCNSCSLIAEWSLMATSHVSGVAISMTPASAPLGHQKMESFYFSFPFLTKDHSRGSFLLGEGGGRGTSWAVDVIAYACALRKV